MLKKIIKAFPFCLIILLLSSCANSAQKSTINEIANDQKTKKDCSQDTSIEVTDNKVDSTMPKVSEEASEPEEVELSTENASEDFCEIDTNVCGGIFFDNEGNMVVARPLGLDKVTADGRVTSFCDLSTLEMGKNYYFKSPFIWDMKYDSNKNIIAAAQDRILKIDADGNVTTLIRDDFNGFLGASGLELDKEGNIYVVNGDRVYKYSTNLERTEYLCSESYNSFFSIAFSPDGKYLYLTDFNTKALVKYDINEDGSLGDSIEIVREPVKNSGSYGAPLNIVFGESGNTYISIDGMARILVIDKNDMQSLIPLSGFVSNHIIAFGSKEFGEDYIYFTTYGNKVCKLKLNDKLSCQVLH